MKLIVKTWSNWSITSPCATLCQEVPHGLTQSWTWAFLIRSGQVTNYVVNFLKGNSPVSGLYMNRPHPPPALLMVPTSLESSRFLYKYHCSHTSNHTSHPPMKMELIEVSETSKRHIQTRRRGITLKKIYYIQSMAKVWKQEVTNCLKHGGALIFSISLSILWLFEGTVILCNVGNYLHGDTVSHIRWLDSYMNRLTHFQSNWFI
jgi:hypothetical protein